MQRLIDADALKECFPDYGEGLCTFNVIINAVIDKQPTIEAEPVKHGKWIFKPTFPNDDSEFPMGSLVCSICGSHHSNATPCNYCDNCGARMNKDE